MSLNHKSLAMPLILILLAGAAGSYFYGKSIWAKAGVAQSALAKAKEQLASDQRVSQQVISALASEPTAFSNRAVSANLVEFLAMANAARANFGVRVDGIASDSAANLVGPEGADVSVLATPVPISNNQVSGVALKIKGMYESYGQFKNFFVTLTNLPVRIDKMQIDSASFEGTITVLGASEHAS